MQWREKKIVAVTGKRKRQKNFDDKVLVCVFFFWQNSAKRKERHSLWSRQVWKLKWKWKRMYDEANESNKKTHREKESFTMAYRILFQFLFFTEKPVVIYFRYFHRAYQMTILLFRCVWVFRLCSHCWSTGIAFVFDGISAWRNSSTSKEKKKPKKVLYVAMQFLSYFKLEKFHFFPSSFRGFCCCYHVFH